MIQILKSVVEDYSEPLQRKYVVDRRLATKVVNNKNPRSASPHTLFHNINGFISLN